MRVVPSITAMRACYSMHLIRPSGEFKRFAIGLPAKANLWVNPTRSSERAPPGAFQSAIAQGCGETGLLERFYGYQGPYTVAPPVAREGPHGRRLGGGLANR